MCRSRRELSNAYLLAKIGVDTAENEPLEVWRENSIQYSLHSLVGTVEDVVLAPGHLVVLLEGLETLRDAEVVDAPMIGSRVVEPTKKRIRVCRRNRLFPHRDVDVSTVFTAVTLNCLVLSTMAL